MTDKQWKRISDLCEYIGVGYYTDEPGHALMYRGDNRVYIPNDYDPLHEIGHWLLATDGQRSMPNFGLGMDWLGAGRLHPSLRPGNPTEDMDMSMDARQVRDMDLCVCVLTVSLCRAMSIGDHGFAMYEYGMLEPDIGLRAHQALIRAELQHPVRFPGLAALPRRLGIRAMVMPRPRAGEYS